jgi:hypothetical protein
LWHLVSKNRCQAADAPAQGRTQKQILRHRFRYGQLPIGLRPAPVFAVLKFPAAGLANPGLVLSIPDTLLVGRMLDLTPFP